ncbi:MAG: hypothetical protein HGA19_06075, partial [Oscillochloris sp.]|nr:hypothetical protein [Oscillochloris sp.]
MYALRRSILLAFLIALLAIFAIPEGTLAQSGVWRERQTKTFAIIYTAGQEAEAERYAGFIDTVYDEISSAFNYQPRPPLTLRLYSTSEDYYQVNPAGRNLPGIVAHADFRRRELVVIIERTLQQNEEEVRNNVRHELTHIVAADLSESRLNTGFQEGIAQYLERPTPELDAKIMALSLAANQGRLMPWSTFDDRDATYSEPEVSYPQSLSVVAFLVDRDGFATLRQFLSISARSSGYRSALERAYGVSVSDLEAEWLKWLPSYLAGGYKTSALDRYDLSFARELLEQGNYSTAASELSQAIEWIAKHADTQPAEVALEANQLKAKAEDGMRAMQLAENARTALESSDYERAKQLIGQARTIFARIGDTRQADVLDTYEQRVLRGLAATQRLIQANDLARSLRFPQARSTIDAAAQEFAALNDQLRLTNALELRPPLDSRQRLAGAGR